MVIVVMVIVIHRRIVIAVVVIKEHAVTQVITSGQCLSLSPLRAQPLGVSR